ncbi:thiamine diphosphokinase [Paracoccus aminophilus]|uniref:Thiamine diphosphokinase n=1 Tax=Paracoccus aminophilus JCM 7686 TaxID=1367847 RepID=S5YDS4_PARAH|nr:thiamine diphosphokinase [Paracoccus aminophilus]AGT09598.1 thiamine pyrophosphokinase [Paracoccus aminophilus JCM 7686]
MSGRVLVSADGVTLIGGGEVSQADLTEARARAPRLVAADGGADQALRFGEMPDAVIGDFDSISPEARAAIPKGRLHHIAEQNSTDFEKCLSRIKAPFVLALGFLGGRIDHELAVLSRISQDPARIILIGAEDIIFRAPAHFAIDLPIGSRFSLFPMGPSSGHSHGLRWPIARIGFAPNGRIGTSNEVSGPVELEITGPMLIILPRAALDAALTALQH